MTASIKKLILLESSMKTSSPSHALSLCMILTRGRGWFCHLNVSYFAHSCVHRFSQVAAVLPWRLSAVTFPSSPAGVWLSAGWSQAGGWDGSSSMTGMMYLDPRYVVFLYSFSFWNTVYCHMFLTDMQYASSADSTGSGETQSADSGGLQYNPGGPGQHPQQHTSKLLQQNHQLSEGA